MIAQCTIQRVCLNNYAKLLEELDLNTTRELKSIDGKSLLCTDEFSLALDRSSFILECEQDAPAHVKEFGKKAD